MKRIAMATGMLLLMLAVFAQGQSPNPTPPPELKKWNVWAGDWILSGQARDTPQGPEYPVEWKLHEHWILGGFFMQVDQTWKGNGQEAKSLEILSYDPVRKIHTVSGFSSDGATWSLTATFEDATVIENGESTGADGEPTRCRMTWVFSDDRRALSGTQECEHSGVRWTAINVRGTKSHVRR